jgi:hypothetical protein
LLIGADGLRHHRGDAERGERDSQSVFGVSRAREEVTFAVSVIVTKSATVPNVVFIP